jgi:hypothetical protein
MISAYERGRAAAQHGKHIQASPFDTGTNEWRSCAIGSMITYRHHMIRLVSWQANA